MADNFLYSSGRCDSNKPCGGEPWVFPAGKKLENGYIGRHFLLSPAGDKEN